MTEAAISGLPIRLVSRLLAEMQTSILNAGIPAFDGDLDRFGIFALIVRQSGLGAGEGATPAAISINSLATSLSRPFETMRRHVNAMIADGLCMRTSAGVIAAPGYLERPAIVRTLQVTHDSFVRLVEDLIAFDQPMPMQRPIAYDPGVSVRAGADMMLAVADGNMVLHHQWMNLALFSTVLCAAMRDVTYDPILARLYATATNVVPDFLCRPVRPSVVARTLHLPYSTAQRRIAQIVAGGTVTKARSGLLPAQAWMNAPDVVAVSTSSFHNIRRILGVAAAAGFPFDNPASAYLVGRPPRAQFD